MAKYRSDNEQVFIDPSQTDRPTFRAQPSVMSSHSRGSKKTSLTQTMKKGLADFFGVGEDNPCEKQNWQNRRMTLAARWSDSEWKHGSVKKDQYRSTDTLDSVFTKGGTTPHVIRDPYSRPRYDRAESGLSRQMSTSSYKRMGRTQPTRRAKKESVAHMAWEGLSSMIRGTPKSKRKPHMHSRSFAPASMSSITDDTGEDLYPDDVFFDVATPTSPMVQPFSGGQPFASMYPTLPPLQEEGAPEAQAAKVPPTAVVSPLAVDSGARPTKHGWQVGPKRSVSTPFTPSPHLKQDVDETDSAFPGFKRIGNAIMQNIFDNSDRRAVGMGFMGRLCSRNVKKHVSKDVKRQLDEMDDHRPFFTYWITFVQIVIFIVAIAVYGIAPIGFEQTTTTELILKPNLAKEQTPYTEKDNFWIGPREADLIHLGAKYSPCMRKDENVEKQLVTERVKENGTACCIRNDGSGCVQTQEKECSKTLSTWHKWTEAEPGFEGRVSGSVCGQDPKYCKNPASQAPFKWADDITQWPICKESYNASQSSTESRHMSCEVVGRPCCVGIHGLCMITTREHCEFVRGYFHEEATLCSQVDCMNEICGMIPFLYKEKPDQFYRLWLSLFLHAGFVQLVITVLFQFFIMRDLEKLAGWIRIAIIYLGSGVAGSLASAIFLPYHVEAGPSGSQFGLLACLFVEVIQTWQLLESPWRAIGKLTAITLALFVIGLLPMVDNYAHLIGFIFGFLLAFAFLPYVTFGQFDRKRKIISIVVALLAAVGLFALLIVLFYVTPVYQCQYCHYFNCIPFTDKFCKSMEVNITRASSF